MTIRPDLRECRGSEGKHHLLSRGAGESGGIAVVIGQPVWDIVVARRLPNDENGIGGEVLPDGSKIYYVRYLSGLADGSGKINEGLRIHEWRCIIVIIYLCKKML